MKNTFRQLKHAYFKKVSFLMDEGFGSAVIEISYFLLQAQGD
jgi:hypothetical protein